MNAAPANSVATEINRLHEEAKRNACASRAALDAALAAAWHAGELLLAEKKRVIHTMGLGSWLLWIDANFRGTARTAQRYMKLARSVTDPAFLRGLSLRQAYARLGIATEPKSGGAHSLRHRLPAHLVHANRLLRALKRPGRLRGGTDAAGHLRQDLRPLFEVLRPWFTEPKP